MSGSVNIQGTLFPAVSNLTFREYKSVVPRLSIKRILTQLSLSSTFKEYYLQLYLDWTFREQYIICVLSEHSGNIITSVFGVNIQGTLSYLCLEWTFKEHYIIYVWSEHSGNIISSVFVVNIQGTPSIFEFEVDIQRILSHLFVEATFQEFYFNCPWNQHLWNNIVDNQYW